MPVWLLPCIPWTGFCWRQNRNIGSVWQLQYNSTIINTNGLVIMNVWKFLTIKDTPYFWKCSMLKIQDLFSHIEVHLPSEFGAFHFISCYIRYYGIKKIMYLLESLSQFGKFRILSFETLMWDLLLFVT